MAHDPPQRPIDWACQFKGSDKGFRSCHGLTLSEHDEVFVKPLLGGHCSTVIMAPWQRWQSGAPILAQGMLFFFTGSDSDKAGKPASANRSLC